MPISHIALSPTLSLSRVCTGTLSDLSFSVGRGEVVSLLGGGASDVLEVVAGFIRAKSGETMLAGRLVDATPTHRRPIGMAAWPPALFPHLNVADHARFAPGVSADRVTEILHLFGLQPHARSRPADLTPDLQLRVALARAIAPAPRLLLLQNPWNGAADTASLKSLLRGLAARAGLGILHADLAPAGCFGFADRVGVMVAGRLGQLDTAQTLYDRPDSLDVAEAMGPINRLRGTVLDHEDDIVRVRLDDGPVVEAHSPLPLTAGQACILALRPERVAVASASLADMGDGAVPANLVETVFEGDRVRLRFKLVPSGDELLVFRPAGAALPAGPSMCLAWQAYHAHAFPEGTP